MILDTHYRIKLKGVKSNKYKRLYHFLFLFPISYHKTCMQSRVALVKEDSILGKVFIQIYLQSQRLVKISRRKQKINYFFLARNKFRKFYYDIKKAKTNSRAISI